MLKLISVVLFTIFITGCTPKFDWREVHGGDSPYTVLMPAKTSELSRDIQLGTQTVSMHMTAAQIDGVNFAVGAAKMRDATTAQMTITVIKNALLQKMAGHVTHEKTSIATVNGKITFTDEFGATGSTTNLATSPPRMLGRLVARDVWVYQVLVVGSEKDINKEAVETFLNSFKPD